MWGYSMDRPNETRAKDAHVWARNDLDWYVEPSRCTAQLLTVERFRGEVYDPCCGGGNIVKALRSAGLEAYGCDVKRRVPEDTPWWRGERDFLNGPKFDYTNIVFNPPFFKAKGAEGAIRRALEVAEMKVCAFVDRRFVTGSGRANGLYRDHPPTRVWEITPRPSCPPGEWLEAGNVAGGGTADYCWLVWDLFDQSGRTELGWLTADPGDVI